MGEVEEGGEVAEVEERVGGDAGEELGEETSEGGEVDEVKWVDDAEHDDGFDEEGERLLEILADWQFPSDGEGLVGHDDEFGGDGAEAGADATV